MHSDDGGMEHRGWGCAVSRARAAQVRTALEGLRADADPDVQHFARLALEALA